MLETLPEVPKRHLVDIGHEICENEHAQTEDDHGLDHAEEHTLLALEAVCIGSGKGLERLWKLTLFF